MARKDELNKLLSIIDTKLVVTEDKAGAIYIGGERADPARLANLHAEAEFFAESDLWAIINQTVRELAHQAMFVSGKEFDDLKKGRSMLYLLDTQSKIVETFRKTIHKPIKEKP